ncbi:MAG: HoxN/HupN/NixA family nickel/cobalt transporter [Cypionkella sp.]
MLKQLFASASPQLKRNVVLMLGFLIVFNLAAWALTFVVFAQHPLLLGTALLAYSFGLRHAVDADHIAAVDNITRKLMQEGKRPVSVGLYFSLGHSTTVVVLSLIVAITAHSLQGWFADYRDIGSVIATLVSASFLFLIAAANFVVLRSTWHAFVRVKAGGVLQDGDDGILTAGGGVMARTFRKLFGMMDRGWKIYLLGLLFGLGFDTASEIALLGIAAATAADGLSHWAIMIFPLLFCAGMALVDTIDGILMLGAYGWAYQKPMRKIFYNLTITSISVIVAVLVGGVQTLGLMKAKLGLAGGFWDGVARVNENFGLLGYGIIGFFIVAWLASMAIYKYRRYDEI